MSKYIIFEGVDGSGKTTLAKMLFEILPEPKIFTKEPGSPHSEFCVNIRKLILDNVNQGMNPNTYAYLFAADREEHLDKVVIPALREGKYVVSDRSIFSDYAYRPFHGNHVRKMHFRRIAEFEPIIFFIDAESKVCLNRMTSRGELNEYEKKIVIDRIAEIRENYVKYSFKSLSSGNLFTVNNGKSLEESFDEVLRCMNLFVPTINKYH